MNGEYLSCMAWIDENGVHPTKDHARKYRDWKPSSKTLGNNYTKEIERIIRDRAEEQKLKLCSTNEGELIPEKLKLFRTKIEPNLRRQAKNRLAKYERHATRQREKNQMNPFTWTLDTDDRIREQALGKGRLPRLPNLDPEKLAEKYKKEELWPGFPGPAPAKPEYQDEQHPLNVNHVKRTAQQVGQSKRAATALENYKKTGRLTVPERKTGTWERERQQWEADMPICSKPIQHIEGLDYVVHDARKNLKTRFDEIERGIWREITPIRLKNGIDKPFQKEKHKKSRGSNDPQLSSGAIDVKY